MIIPKEPQSFQIISFFSTLKNYDTKGISNCRYFLKINHPNLKKDIDYNIVIQNANIEKSISSTSILISRCENDNIMLLDVTTKIKNFYSNILYQFTIQFIPILNA
jgi:hypothetical protein